MGSSLNPAGIKKPSPGFILKADASLAPLNNAQIEVRAMSGARAPSRFPPFPSASSARRVKAAALPRETPLFARRDSVDLFERGKSAGSNHRGVVHGRSTHTPLSNFFFFVCFAFVPFPRSRASASRPSPTLTVHEIYEFAAPPSPPSKHPRNTKHETAVLARRRDVVQSRGCVSEPARAHGEGSVRDG